MIRLTLAAGAAAGLSACANLASFSVGELPVAEGSPVALAVEDAVRNPGPKPRFADIPGVPANAPTPAARESAASAVSRPAAELNAQVLAFGPIDPAAPAAFARENLAVFEGVIVPTAADREAAEAFARAARARATPPPAPR